MIKFIDATLSLFFLLLSVGTIQIEGDDSIRSRAKRSAETFGHTTTPDDSDASLCESPAIDAAFYLDGGKFYFFIGAYYWLTVNDKLEPGYPKVGKETWPGLPNTIDAAFSYNNDEVLFFSGTMYRKYTNFTLDPGYPKRIREGFPGIPDDIQAVTVWGKNRYIYFFKGSQYWRYDPKREPPVRMIYPKPISEGWEGIPNDVSEVVLSTTRSNKGTTYFLKGNQYWRFDDAKLKVTGNYPLSVATEWWRCPKQADP